MKPHLVQIGNAWIFPPAVDAITPRYQRPSQEGCEITLNCQAYVVETSITATMAAQIVNEWFEPKPPTVDTLTLDGNGGIIRDLATIKPWPRPADPLQEKAS